jgi:hypothetical protein
MVTIYQVLSEKLAKGTHLKYTEYSNKIKITNNIEYHPIACSCFRPMKKGDAHLRALFYRSRSALLSEFCKQKISDKNPGKIKVWDSISPVVTDITF